MAHILLKARLLLLKLFALIFTSLIIILHFIFKIIFKLPLPKSYIHNDFQHSLTSCCNNPTLHKSLYIIINSTLSLLSALAIANYCQKMLGVVEWTSHKTHMVFLNFVFPNFPEASTYTPSWIVHVYLGLGYLGITSQLSLTLDLMYIYNLPAIYAYKILAFLYSKLLSLIKVCFEIIQYDSNRWITCPYPILPWTNNIVKLIAVASVTILAQILFIVGFYYLWLTLVILMLIFAMNIVKNILQLVYKLSQVILIVKGHRIECKKENEKTQEDYKLWQVRGKMERLRKVEVKWIPLIKIRDVRDVFLGKDIIKGNSVQVKDENLTFSALKIYESFTSVEGLS